MTELQSNTQYLRSIDCRHHLHSFTDPKVIAEQGTRIIVKGDGCFVWDSDGRKILDGMAGLWCVNVGYGRPELVEAAKRQMETLPYYNNHFQSATPQMIRLAQRIANLAPEGLDHVGFACSGSEANDMVVRLLRHYWRVLGKPAKRVIISRTMGYHGSTLLGASLGGMPQMHQMDGELLPDISHIEHPHWYIYGGTMSREQFGLKAARALEERILELGEDRVAAFVAEPVQGAGGVIDPPENYWPEIQRICRKYNVLLVADEVICGFGRTGNWFGSQTLNIVPDFMPMAKGLTSGYLPLAAVAVHDRVHEVLGKGGLLAHGYTFAGHPVSCAVALANLDILEGEGLVDRVRTDIGPYFNERLDELVREHPLLGERRGIGLMAALQLVRDKASRTVCTAEDNAAIMCREKCYEEGLIVRAVDQAIILSPPFTITKDEVDQLITVLKRGLDFTSEKLGVR